MDIVQNSDDYPNPQGGMDEKSLDIRKGSDPPPLPPKIKYTKKNTQKTYQTYKKETTKQNKKIHKPNIQRL